MHDNTSIVTFGCNISHWIGACHVTPVTATFSVKWAIQVDKTLFSARERRGTFSIFKFIFNLWTPTFLRWTCESNILLHFRTEQQIYVKGWWDITSMASLAAGQYVYFGYWQSLGTCNRFGYPFWSFGKSLGYHFLRISQFWFKFGFSTINIMVQVYEVYFFHI